LAVAAGVDADSAGEDETVRIRTVGTGRLTGVIGQIGLVVEVYCAGQTCGGGEAGLAGGLAVFAGVVAEERILWALCDAGEV
jgi:hypothetical protein